MMGFMRTFRKNPGRVLKRMEKILSAWQLQAAEDSFYGMTLKGGLKNSNAFYIM
jgi:hypothetical protein